MITAMSEHAEPSHIGHLADTYSHLKDELHQLEGKLELARRAYQIAAMSFNDLIAHDEKLALNGNSAESYSAPNQQLAGLLNSRELVMLLHERSRVRYELEQVRGKLRSWLNYV